MLSWRDTVMKLKQIEDVLDNLPYNQHPTEMKEWKAIAKAQAEISFKAGHEEGYKLAKNDIEVTQFDVGCKAGIKEVVDWIEEYPSVYKPSPEAIKAKLKEWGMGLGEVE